MPKGKNIFAVEWADESDQLGPGLELHRVLREPFHKINGSKSKRFRISQLVPDINLSSLATIGPSTTTLTPSIAPRKRTGSSRKRTRPNSGDSVLIGKCDDMQSNDCQIVSESAKKLLYSPVIKILEEPNQIIKPETIKKKQTSSPKLNTDRLEKTRKAGSLNQIQPQNSVQRTLENSLNNKGINLNHMLDNVKLKINNNTTYSTPELGNTHNELETKPTTTLVDVDNIQKEGIKNKLGKQPSEQRDQTIHIDDVPKLPNDPSIQSGQFILNQLKKQNDIIGDVSPRHEQSYSALSKQTKSMVPQSILSVQRELKWKKMELELSSHLKHPNEATSCLHREVEWKKSEFLLLVKHWNDYYNNMIEVYNDILLLERGTDCSQTQKRFVVFLKKFQSIIQNLKTNDLVQTEVFDHNGIAAVEPTQNELRLETSNDHGHIKSGQVKLYFDPKEHSGLNSNSKGDYSIQNEKNAQFYASSICTNLKITNTDKAGMSNGGTDGKVDCTKHSSELAITSKVNENSTSQQGSKSSREADSFKDQNATTYDHFDCNPPNPYMLCQTRDDSIGCKLNSETSSFEYRSKERTQNKHEDKDIGPRVGHFTDIIVDSQYPRRADKKSRKKRKTYLRHRRSENPHLKEYRRFESFSGEEYDINRQKNRHYSHKRNMPKIESFTSSNSSACSFSSFDSIHDQKRHCFEHPLFVRKKPLRSKQSKIFFYKDSSRGEKKLMKSRNTQGFQNRPRRRSQNDSNIEEKKCRKRGISSHSRNKDYNSQSDDYYKHRNSRKTRKTAKNNQGHIPYLHENTFIEGSEFSDNSSAYDMKDNDKISQSHLRGIARKRNKKLRMLRQNYPERNIHLSSSKKSVRKEIFHKNSKGNINSKHKKDYVDYETKGSALDTLATISPVGPSVSSRTKTNNLPDHEMNSNSYFRKSFAFETTDDLKSLSDHENVEVDISDIECNTDNLNAISNKNVMESGQGLVKNSSIKLHIESKSSENDINKLKNDQVPPYNSINCKKTVAVADVPVQSGAQLARALRLQERAILSRVIHGDDESIVSNYDKQGPRVLPPPHVSNSLT